MWPFKKRDKTTATDKTPVIPPVDLDKPVENPRLLAAITAHQTSPSTQTELELVNQLRSANFLVATMMGEEAIVREGNSNQAVFQAGSHINILSCSDDGGQNLLALFTDWKNVSAWTDAKVSGMVMPSVDAWQFALSNYHGVVINPGGLSIRLSLEQIQSLISHGSRRASEDVQRHVLTQEVPLQFRVARAVPAAAVAAIRRVCEANSAVKACILLDAREPNSSEGNIRLFINLLLSDEQQFDKVATEIMSALQSFPEQASKAFVGSMEECANYIADAIFKR